MKTAVLFVLFFVVSCGESPLFNHKFEAKNFLSTAVLADSDVLTFKNSGFSFIINWEEGPMLGASRFRMRTWKTNQGSINGPFQDVPKTLNVFLWMPAMGHGSAPVKLKKVADGEYEISEVQFIMGGKWEVKFQLKDGSQVVDETVVSVSI